MMTTRRRCVTAWSTETILRHQRRSKPLEFSAPFFMSNGRLTDFWGGWRDSNPRPLEPQSRQECTPCALTLVKHAFWVRAINLQLPRFAPEPLHRPYSARRLFPAE